MVCSVKCFILLWCHIAYIQYKVPTESLEYFVNHIFWDLFGNEVYRIVYHCKALSFLFVTIASSRAETLALQGGGVGK